MSDASPSPYPRDMRGYGRQVPDARWPGGARIALQFVLNYEEGGENNVLHGDPASETFLSELVTAQAYEGRHMTMESMYEYGSRVGVWRILREFQKRRLPLTVFGVVSALQRYPELSWWLRSWSTATRSPTTACAGSITNTCPKRPSGIRSARQAAS
jgi:allantoinase